MSRHPRADLYVAERAKGKNYREIAQMYGVSYQVVAAACGKHSPNLFKPFTEKQVVYPNLRRWLNENKVGKREFARRMGNVPGGNEIGNLASWFCGKAYPSKKTIDLMLKITGLTYEELFMREDDNGQ